MEHHTLINYIYSGEFETDYKLKDNKRSWAEKFKRNFSQFIEKWTKDNNATEFVTNFLVNPYSEPPQNKQTIIHENEKVSSIHYLISNNLDYQKDLKDTDRLFNFFLEKACLNDLQTIKIEKWKKEIIKLSTYDERFLIHKKQLKGGLNFVIPSLIDKYIQDFKDKEDDYISIQPSKDEESFKYLLSFFGLSLFAEGTRENLKKALPEIADVLAAGGGVVFGSIAGIVLLGISALFGYHAGKQGEIF